MRFTRTVPLVMLPGLLCDAALWRPQITDLAAVVSATVADLTLDDSVEHMATRVLAAAPPIFSLAALSMGGYVAFEILRQAPERVNRIALFSTSAAPDTPARSRLRKSGMDTLGQGQFRGVTDRLLPQLIHGDHIGGPVADQVKDMAKRVGLAAFIRQQKAIATRPDSRPMLGRVTIPTLIAVGDCDVPTPTAEATAMAAAIGGSELHVLAKCGHLPALEKPAETSRLLRRWLEA